MAFDTILQQGRFTSAGIPVDLNLRSDVDFVYAYNETIMNDAALAADRAAWCYWQRGMAVGRGMEIRKLGTVANDPLTTLQLAANAGFFLYDSTGDPTGPDVAQTGVTNVVAPVVTTANTGRLAVGSIVRLNSDANIPNIMGFDWEVGAVVPGANFTMAYNLANAPGAAGAGAGFYRHIYYNPIYYPRRRNVINITAAAAAVVTVSVSHGYTVGQQIRMKVPAAFGMVQMNNLVGTITAVTAGTFTLNIDSTAFTAFVFPAVAAVPFDWAEVTPIGQDTGATLTAGGNILADATRNTGELGITLIAGVNSPAGAANDVIYWVAGKSFSVTNL